MYTKVQNRALRIDMRVELSFIIVYAENLRLKRYNGSEFMNPVYNAESYGVILYGIYST